MDNYQTFIATSRYCRWLPEESRRETFEEAVGRYTGFLKERTPKKLHKELEEAQSRILDLDVMPSMRALMTAGPALERCNVAGYNCAYLPVDNVRAFDEAMYILMCGTGVGFSVEKHNVEKLPVVNEHFEQTETTIIVCDSKSGWARSFRELISLLYSGQIPQWDTSNVRAAGERLKTFGGRASGPAPLVSLFNFTVETFRGASGRKLKPLECHDLMCKIGEVVVVGGVRRSALISLSDLDDYEMARAKSGNWWEDNPQRALANNSAVYKETPNAGQFMREWKAIYDSKSGERGIFNRRAVVDQVKRNGRREHEGIDFGTNPCSEIILRPHQFCNLTEVVVRRDDGPDLLKGKIESAVLLGTLQSNLTDFKYLRRIWQKNCEEERLLGVSLTGVFDNPLLIANPEMLEELRDFAVDCNKRVAKLLGINQSVAVTCVKPSGTVSQLVDSASGLHPRHSRYYIRTVRGDNKDPLTQLMKAQGVPHEADVMKPDDTTVFTFYQKAPEGALTRDDISAVEHLDIWMAYQKYWCEHKPSVTINVRENEWPILGGEVYENFSVMTGVALLPHSDHTYQQAPYQEITKEQYDEGKANEPNVDWDALEYYETEDHTKGSQSLACTGGSCEIVDLT
jgi:ribonucleoside-diphosphate reductase alpha chain